MEGYSSTKPILVPMRPVRQSFNKMLFPQSAAGRVLVFPLLAPGPNNQYLVFEVETLMHE